MSKCMDLTILIPTMNRHEFLARALKYYEAMKFDGCIFIGDSSTEDQWRYNVDLVDSIQEAGSLNIIYHLYPNPPHLHDGMVVQKMNEEVTTKYVAQTGDDDFFIVSNIQKCIDFLEDNSDYIGAHGRRVGIKLLKDKPYGDLIAFCGWPEQNWTGETALERWQTYNKRPLSSQAWVFYANAWKQVYNMADKTPCRYLGPEFLPCSIQAILGKSIELDFLTLVCQVGHLHQIFNFERYPIFDLLCSNVWPESMTAVKETLLDHLCTFNMPQDKREEVKETILKGIWSHMIFFMNEQFKKKYMPEEKENQGEDIRFTKNKDFMLPNPSWNDYLDFMPVYDILIKDKPYKDEVYNHLKTITKEKENA